MAAITPLFLNAVSGTVQAGSSAIGSASATGVNVAAGEGAAFGTIGTNQFIPAVIVDTSTSPETVKEFVWITARSTDALTVVREAEDSSRYPASTTSIAAGYVIAAVASGNALRGPGAWRPAHQGLAAAAYDFFMVNTTAQPPSGRVMVTQVPVPQKILVSNICIADAVVMSGGTAGQNFLGLYDSSLNRIAVTADLTTDLSSGTQLKTAALTTPVIVGGNGADDYVWAALLFNATSRPTVVGITDSNPTRIMQGLTPVRAGVASGSGQTSMPATISSPSAFGGTPLFWFGLT